MMATMVKMVVVIEGSHDLSLSQICVPHIAAQYLFIYLFVIYSLIVNFMKLSLGQMV
jgi:hypothetical protein